MNSGPYRANEEKIEQQRVGKEFLRLTVKDMSNEDSGYVHRTFIKLSIDLCLWVDSEGILEPDYQPESIKIMKVDNRLYAKYIIRHIGENVHGWFPSAKIPDYYLPIISIETEII